MEEAPAEIEPPSAAQDGGVKPEEATTGGILRLSQHGGANSLGSTVTKGEDAHSEEPAVKPRLRLRLDHIREVSTASATSAPDPSVPVGDSPSYLLDSDVSEAKLTRAQRKRLRDKARHAQVEQRKIVRPPYREASNSEDNLVAQEPKPAPTAPVDEPDTVTVPETTVPETTVPEKTTAYIDDDFASWWY